MARNLRTGTAAMIGVLLAALVLPAAAAAPATPAALEAPASNDTGARAAVAALPRATTVNDRDGNKVFDDLDTAYATASPAQRLPVIVSFVEGVSTGAGVERVRSVAPDAVVTRMFSIIPAYAGALDHGEAAVVASLPEVRQVELDRQGTPELDTATEVMGAGAVVDELQVTGSLDDDPDEATVADVAIAVLDTGIYAEHLDLREKLVAWRDFGTNRDEPYDPNSHGTHVASIAAGWGRADPAHRGVAPGASLVGLKIDGGGNTSSNAIAAYEWAVENRDELNIRVATISFGFGTATDGTTALERTVDAVWDAGIVCTKSNGNGGPRNSTMTVPAAARGILSVGSILDPFGAGSSKYGFTLSEFSSRGPTSDGRTKPDIVAPGESIRAAGHQNPQQYTEKSGTSMAAPFVAGAVALVLGADPSLQPDDVRELLFATAEDRGAQGPDNDFGHGRLQVWHAVAAALEASGGDPSVSAPPTVPVHEAHTATPSTGIHELTFTVTDRSFPVAATVLGEHLVHAVEVFDPDGERVHALTTVANLPDRQHHVTFRPDSEGDYVLRAVVPPATEVVVDLSHSTSAPDS